MYAFGYVYYAMINFLKDFQKLLSSLIEETKKKFFTLLDGDECRFRNRALSIDPAWPIRFLSGTDKCSRVDRLAIVELRRILGAQ